MKCGMWGGQVPVAQWLRHEERYVGDREFDSAVHQEHTAEPHEVQRQKRAIVDSLILITFP